MLRISKLTDYATVIMSYLARDMSGVFSATHIAHEIHLSIPTVSKILKMLWQAKLVNSFRGTGGGYQLSKSPKDISIAEVVKAMEGSVSMTECCGANSGCALERSCGVKENWQLINRVILKSLTGLTIADMVQRVA